MPDILDYYSGMDESGDGFCGKCGSRILYCECEHCDTCGRFGEDCECDECHDEIEPDEAEDMTP